MYLHVEFSSVKAAGWPAFGNDLRTRLVDLFKFVTFAVTVAGTCDKLPINKLF